MSFTVIAYHTPDDLYRQHAELLAYSLDALGIAYHFQEIESKSWLGATAFKPEFIRNTMETLDSDVLFLDIDCVVRSDITAFYDQLNADIACHIRPSGELISGTLYFRQSTACVQLLESWIQQLKDHPEQWDQVALHEVLKRHDIDLKVEKLPASHVFIFDLTAEENPGMQPVIEHLQASRESRHRTKMKTLKYRILTPLGIYPKSTRRLKARRQRVDDIARQYGVTFRHPYRA